MVTSRLQDDLIQEFRAEQRLINSQLSRFDPLATSLRQPAAQRLIGAGLLVILEVLCYAGALGIAFLSFLHRSIYPLYLLDRFRRPEYESLIGATNITNLQFLVYGLMTGIFVLLFWLARGFRRIRLKNAILSRTGVVVRDFVGELLQRKAALDAIEQRHFDQLPHTTDNSSVTSVSNPAYDTPQPRPRDTH
jgi:hypothetical protein